ncbi:hypothetical protein ACS3YM_11555 [Nocardia sp. N13]|uniref:hypothetical protein n=1 Tax=Nocardioides sp. N13(2025) TaxID=3453405 RepID=UPI003F766873
MTTDMRDDGPDDAFADPALAGLLAELRAVADQPAPAAGAELTALLAGAAPITPARARRSRTASAVVIGLVSSGVLAGGVGAAAADQLPAPVQRVVSRVVDTLTPFEVPHPDQRVPARHERDDDPPLPQAPADLDDTDDTDVSPPGTPGAPDPSRPDDPKQSRDTEESERPEEAEEAEEADVSGDSDSGEGEDDSTAERDDRTKDRSGERDGDASEDDERSGDSSGDSSDDSGGAGDDSEDHRD